MTTAPSSPDPALRSPDPAPRSPDPTPGSPRSPESPPGPTPLVLTGERTLPGIDDERYWFQRHVVAYLAAVAHLGELAGDDQLTVLDAGCGEGYGLAMLAEAGATRVIGVDLEPPVVAHARATYASQDPRIEVLEAELSALPLEDGVADLTVSFQVIEHLHDIPSYLDSMARVTAADGQVWIATPNRLTFTPGSDVPVNPFHVREFTAAELQTELERAGFVLERMLGVHHGARIRAEEARLGRSLIDAQVAVPPGQWDPALRAAVHATTPDDFVLREDDLDASLDLLAVARPPDTRPPDTRPLRP